MIFLYYVTAQRAGNTALSLPSTYAITYISTSQFQVLTMIL